MRKCPACGLTWHSADAEGVWKCSNCNADIPAEEVETDKEKAAHEAADVNYFLYNSTT